ncbi:MAG: hypothetical protein LH473_06595 [Chitinophagales bacterium]|nr:hypothetical protein [Chitinophagales bacterium]
MNKAFTFLEKISKEIAGAKLSKMFSADCIKAPNGKVVCMVWKDDMVFKLTGDDEKEAMKIKGAHVFSPMEGRVMGGWIQIPAAHQKLWMDLAKKSFLLVSKIKMEKKEKKKT